MLDTYRRELTEFNAAHLKEHYLFASGQACTLNLSEIYDRYADLFSKDSIARLKGLLSDTPSHFESDRAGLGRLVAFAVEHFLENAVRELTESISRFEASATVKWAGLDETFQNSALLVASEPDRSLRSRLFAEREAVIEASNDLRRERLRRLHDGAGALGYPSYTKLFEELRSTDYGLFAQGANKVLEQTDDCYAAELSRVLKSTMNLEMDEAQRPDALYLLHLNTYQDNFPAEDLLPIYRRTLQGLGIEPDGQANLRIDSAVRPRKAPRAVCFPIRVPDEIIIVIRPVGGQSDYQTLLHEAGHAQHYAWTSPGLRPEFKHASDYSLTETYAFLFNHLISEPSWLAQFFGFQHSAEFVRFVLLLRLVTVRRYASKAIYETQLHSSHNGVDPSLLYSELLTKGTSFRTPETEFLFELDDAFYSASYLRAWAFEIMLREYLRTKFGRLWWNNVRAGSFLKEIWETGDRYSADEMACQLGIGPIGFEPLISDFLEELS